MLKMSEKKIEKKRKTCVGKWKMLKTKYLKVRQKQHKNTNNNESVNDEHVWNDLNSIK